MKRVKMILGRVVKDIRQYWVAGAVFVFIYLAVRAFFGAFCPFLITTGFPCAGCGLTRAALSLLKGDVGRAAAINPSIFMVIFFLLYCGYFRYIRGTHVKGFPIALGMLVAATLAVYICGMYLYFPDQVPYVYRRKNLLAAAFPWYKQLVESLI